MKELKFLPEFLPKIKSGEKTCTRRPIKPQPPDFTENGTPYTGHQRTTLPWNKGFDLTAYIDNPKYIGECPYGDIGTIRSLEDGAVIIIKNVRIERVQDISPEECLNEDTNGLTEFLIIWDSIYKKRGYGWEENPLVWVIDFEVVK